MSGAQQRRTISSFEELAAAVATAERLGSIGLAHLMRARLAGRVALWPVMPECSAGAFKRFVSLCGNQPAVSLIPADDYSGRGPESWPVTRRIMEWSRSVILHATGAEIEHYESAIVAAQFVRRVLLIECCDATLPAWLALLRSTSAIHRPSLIIVTRDGGQHPMPISRETMQ